MSAAAVRMNGHRIPDQKLVNVWNPFYHLGGAGGDNPGYLRIRLCTAQVTQKRHCKYSVAYETVPKYQYPLFFSHAASPSVILKVGNYALNRHCLEADLM